ncbi:MAG: protease modulator HflC [Deltaproteobacteria bacterium]|nr:MAG: protease modulator HflC [Deltaproteobacteria bacterium]
MRRGLLFVLLGAGLALLAVAGGNLGIPPVVITREGEQKLILLYGQVRNVTQPGISLAIPFVEEVRTYDSRWLYNSTAALPIQTKDGEQLLIDYYTVWRVGSPRDFVREFPGGMEPAEQQIDRVVGDGVRKVIGRHTLGEVLKDERAPIVAAITENARKAFAPVGIEVADVRINRTELPSGAEESVYARMKTERERLAKKNRAEGEERARAIRAAADREARVIVATARKESEIARGQGDAEAARIYAEAYTVDPDFYGFTRSLEAYRKTIDGRTTLVISPDTEFFKYLEGPGRE